MYVPMALHSDAVPLFRVGKAGSKSMEVHSTSSLFAIGEAKAINISNLGFVHQHHLQEGQRHYVSHMVYHVVVPEVFLLVLC